MDMERKKMYQTYVDMERKQALIALVMHRIGSISTIAGERKVMSNHQNLQLSYNIKFNKGTMLTHIVVLKKICLELTTKERFVNKRILTVTITCCRNLENTMESDS